MRGLQPHEKVDVVCDSACFLRESAQSRDGAPEVFMQPFPPSLLDVWSTRLGAENDVIVQAQKS